MKDSGILGLHIVVVVLGSIVVSIPACHAGDRGSIPRRGEEPFRISFDVPDTFFCRFPGTLVNISLRYFILKFN